MCQQLPENGFPKIETIGVKCGQQFGIYMFRKQQEWQETWKETFKKKNKNKKQNLNGISNLQIATSCIDGSLYRFFISSFKYN